MEYFDKKNRTLCLFTDSEHGSNSTRILWNRLFTVKRIMKYSQKIKNKMSRRVKNRTIKSWSKFLDGCSAVLVLEFCSFSNIYRSECRTDKILLLPQWKVEITNLALNLCKLIHQKVFLSIFFIN